MKIPRSVAEVLDEHVTLEVEGIDRMYLNVYIPGLQREQGVACFFRFHRGHQFASSALMDPISKAFVAALEAFARQEKIPLILFRKGQRKDDVAAEQRKRFQKTEGVVFIGKAQEKTPVFRTERRRSETTGATYPWLVRSTAMVNHFYIYCVDRDFGPFFLKFSTYFPYNAKLCLNGHEYAKRQLAQKGIGFEALDNGVLSCDNPKRLQAICDGLSAEKIDALLRKWLRILPHPYEARDRKAGYRYQISILQAEFSLTQVLDRPVTGRVFFEEVIRENLDIGRPSQVQLIFDRRVNKTTPGRFRTRIITDGVIPSLHVDYKNTRIKQYHKEGRALRTETTINNTHGLRGSPDPSRRGFLNAMVGGGVMLGYARSGLAAPATGGASDLFEPTIWYGVDPSGVVTVNIIRAEMGQHVGTALARIVADELEADWNKVKTVTVDSDPKWGLMVTGGSWSVWQSFPLLSRAGAAGRIALVEEGAKLLGVSPQSCTARNGAVHAKGKSISYGDIVARGDLRRTFTPEQLQKKPIKPPAERRLIGKDVVALDVPSKVNGKGRYGLDAAVDGMIYARPIIPPTRYGSKAISIDDSAAKHLPGYIRSVAPDGRFSTGRGADQGPRQRK